MWHTRSAPQQVGGAALLGQPSLLWVAPLRMRVMPLQRPSPLPAAGPVVGGSHTDAVSFTSWHPSDSRLRSPKQLATAANSPGPPRGLLIWRAPCPPPPPPCCAGCPCCPCCRIMQQQQQQQHAASHAAYQRCAGASAAATQRSLPALCTGPLLPHSLLLLTHGQPTHLCAPSYSTPLMNPLNADASWLITLTTLQINSPVEVTPGAPATRAQPPAAGGPQTAAGLWG